MHGSVAIYINSLHDFHRVHVYKYVNEIGLGYCNIESIHRQSKVYKNYFSRRYFFVIETLYQSDPVETTVWDDRGSFTLSRRSYDIGACREAIILSKINGSIPHYDVRINYQDELSVSQIKKLWSRLSIRLRLKGIVARVAIEITKDDTGCPVNRVHYHIAVSESKADTPGELKAQVREVCLREMPAGSFKVSGKTIDDWNGYVWYFVKYRRRDNYLFQPIGLHKFYTINEAKFWIYPDGTQWSKEEIEKEMKQYAETQSRLAELEEFIELNIDNDSMARADQVRLKKLLDNESEETLYDWYSILLAKPAVFQTIPHRWLTETLPSYPLKWHDLLVAIENRIEQSNNPDILYALKIYHDYRQWNKDTIAKR